MLQTLVVTLREGVEAALVISIALVYLKKSGRGEYARIVYYALAAAVAASIAAAVLLDRWVANQEAFEGWVLLLAAFFVATVVYWMHRTSRSLRRHIEQRLETIVADRQASAWGIFLFVFFMVFREGAETVLMLSAVSLNSSDLMNFFGGVLGLSLAVVFGVMFVRGSVRLDLRKFFQITTIILICVIFQLVITGLHELSEAGVLPSSQWEMAIIGPIVSNEVFFVVAILALAAWMILIDWRARQPLAADPSSAGAAASSVERRKQLWTARRERLWTAAVCGSAFVFILMVTAEYLYAKSQTALSPATAVSATGDAVRISAGTVADGNLHRFLYEGPAGAVRFIVLRVGERYAAALDACTICGPQGYYQSGPNIFCRNCSAAIYGPSIGLTGGCNPIPLESSLEGDTLVIPLAEFEKGAGLFQRSE
ncbi:MAG TPA: Fe-S-containing protein [Terriglobia bacterium]|nr:Fe-S-containing protein [Terriglobia bacterium]